MADFAEYAGALVLPLLLLGVLASILLTGLATLPSHRVLKLVYGALGLVLALSAVWLVLYAAGPDTYYGPHEVTRWEHADRWGKTPLVVVAVISAAISSVLLLATAAGRVRESLRFLAGPAAAASGGLLVVGWFFLTTGH